MGIMLMIGIGLVVWIAFGMLLLTVLGMSDDNVPHTAPGSTWCPRCGRCSCLDRIHLIDDAGDPIVYAADCPLHGPATWHPRDPAWQ